MNEYGDFTPRNELKIAKNTINKIETNYDYLIEQANKLNLEEIKFDDADNGGHLAGPRKIDTKIEKQRVYFWIRVFLSEEILIEPGDEIKITYLSSGEELETKFICYAKKGGSSIKYEDGEPVVTNYNAEDDTKILCLMVDEERINNDSQDIPFLRKLFRIGRHFEYVLMKRNELVLTNTSNNEVLKYYDIEF